MSSGRSPPRIPLRGSASVRLAPRGRGCKEPEGYGPCRYPSGSPPGGSAWVHTCPFGGLPESPRGTRQVPMPRCLQSSDHRCPEPRRSSWQFGKPPRGFLSLQYAQSAPRSDGACQTSPCDISAFSVPADCGMPLSSHPCLTLLDGILTGPGPSLRARFAARPSTVLRPDPSPWHLCLHFPLAVIAGISSTGFLRRVPRASPVSTLSFAPCRR